MQAQTHEESNQKRKVGGWCVTDTMVVISVDECDVIHN